MDGIEDSSIPVLTFVPVPNGTDYDDKVLSFCYYQAHKVSEIAEHLGISDSTYLENNGNIGDSLSGKKQNFKGDVF